MNAAIWFGAAVFYVVGAWSMTSSADLKELLGERNFPYYSVRIAELAAVRYYTLYTVCAIIALLHLAAEWLYLGKYPRKALISLLAGLILGGLICGYMVQPTLKRLHTTSYSASYRPDQRGAAYRSFHSWRLADRVINILLTIGLGVYCWRAGNQADPTRFVSATKFTGSQFRS